MKGSSDLYYIRIVYESETITTFPPLDPIAVDFLFLRSQSPEKTIPCILSKEHFGDLLDVEEPHLNKYFYFEPGITQVPMTMFPKILDRVRERNLTILLKCIDPNSLGKMYALTIGVNVNNRGRQNSPK